LRRSRATSRRGFRIPWLIVAALVAVALCLLRAFHIDDFAGGYTACRGCFFIPTLGHDAWLLAVLFALLAIAAAIRSRAIRVVVGTTAALLVLIIAIDVMVGNVVNQRFYVVDMLRFAVELSGDWSVARAELFSPRGMVYLFLLATAFIAFAVVIFGKTRSAEQAKILFAGVIAALLFAGYAAYESSLKYIHGQFTWNVVAANWPPGRSKAFSQAHADQQLEISKALPATCATDRASGKNIVLVITESLSAYQSSLLGGPRDWLPRLDALARDSHYFSHFYANGFTTDGGEISLLTGRLPITPPGAPWYTFTGFGASDASLPAIAHRAGYKIHYFQSSDLAFLQSDVWLRDLGFDSVEGSESPFYAGMTRRLFGAPDDAALFERFDDWLDHRADGDGPFVAVLLTVSGHPPFVNPRDGKTDPEGTFHYVDDQIADFHDRLQKRGFLNNGILMITGDHRSMTPLLDGEYEKFGERAFARIPMIVSGAVDMPKIIDEAFQQSDVPASVAQLLGVQYCRNEFVGTFLNSAPQPAKYLLHTRGDDRDRVDVYFDDRVASYFENGDRSGWSDVTPPDAAKVSAWIDTQRIRSTPPRTAAKR
jgi:lipoteichoic acid synthase